MSQQNLNLMYKGFLNFADDNGQRLPWQLLSRGVTAAIQPGGSVKDEEVIAAADERDIAMVFTGARHFRH